jgi:hypothetical protein
MRKIKTIVMGLSLIASSALFADSNNHMGDHMHNGVMTNHNNPNGMTNAQMNKMSQGNMSANDMAKYHNQMMVNGYNVTLKSEKPLTDGKNHMSIELMKNGHMIDNADMNIKFSMPTMPGMEFTEHAKYHGNMYKMMPNFSMGGEWAYELMFKTSDGHIHTTKGSVNIK